MSAPTVWLVVTLTYPRGGGEPRETPGKPAGSLEGVRGQRVAVRLEPIA